VFDISFSELLIIAIVALIVIGPEKLPKLARTAGAFTGRLQRFLAQVKEEVNREARFEELQKLQQEVKDSVNKVESGIHAEVVSVKSVADQVANELVDTPVKKATRSTTKSSAIKPKASVTKSKVSAATQSELPKKTSAVKSKSAVTTRAKAVKKVID
jgi:sec-independent protein translocase protein TatB